MRNELAADAFPAVTKLVHAIRDERKPLTRQRDPPLSV
jgi:hypothetical protein